MSESIFKDTWIQNILTDTKNFLATQKDKLETKQEGYSLEEHNEEIDEINKQKDEALSLLDEMIQRLKGQPFYTWLHQQIYDKPGNPQKGYMRYANFVYVLNELEELNIESFDYQRFINFDKNGTGDRPSDVMVAWREGFKMDDGEMYINLLKVLYFVKDQYLKIKEAICQKFKSSIDAEQKEKDADKAHLTELYKEVKNKVEKRLHADIDKIKTILQKNGKTYIEKRLMDSMEDVLSTEGEELDDGNEDGNILYE